MRDDGADPGGGVLGLGGERRRLRLQDGGHAIRVRGPVKGTAAGQHLVEDRPQGEDVRAVVGRLVADLLRRHVARRAQDLAGHCERARNRARVVGVAGVGPEQLRQPEVEDLHVIAREDHEVFRLQVPVRDSLCVRRREAAGDLRGVLDGLARRNWPGGELVA